MQSPSANNNEIDDIDQNDIQMFLEILKRPPSFSKVNEECVDEEVSCRDILEELTADEVLEASHTSYAFWYVSTILGTDALPPLAQEHAALKEIRRHWIEVGRDRDQTLVSLRVALKYRKSYNINHLRLLGIPQSTRRMSGTDNSVAIEAIKTLIKDELERQTMIVRGTAKGRAIVFKPPRQSRTNSQHDEGYMHAQVYTAERAMAITEFASKGQCEDVWVLFSFANYSARNSVSLTALTKSTTELQKMYPQRLKLLYVLDPPFWMWAIVSLVKPLLSAETRSKMHMVTYKDESRNLTEKLLGPDDNPQSLDFLANEEPGISVDVARYVTNIPFYRSYDDFRPIS